jgi:hypothetical protein
MVSKDEVTEAGGNHTRSRFTFSTFHQTLGGQIKDDLAGYVARMEEMRYETLASMKPQGKRSLERLYR